MACKTTLQFYNSSNASDPRLLQSWGGGVTLLLRPPWWLGLGDCWRVGKGCPLPSAPKTPSKRFKTPPRRSHDTPKRRQGTKPSARHPSHSQGAPRRLQDAVLTAFGTEEDSKNDANIYSIFDFGLQTIPKRIYLSSLAPSRP